MRRPRKLLTREEIFETGLRLVDAEGLDALTFRRLAQELGVGTMTLYGYVAGKDELLDGVGAAALSALAVGVGDDPSWDSRLAGAVRALYVAHREHPGALQVISAAPASSPALDPIRKRFLEILLGAGFARPDALVAINALFAYAVGCAVNQRSRPGRSGARVPEATFDYGLAHLMDGLRRDAAAARESR